MENEPNKAKKAQTGEKDKKTFDYQWIGGKVFSSRLSIDANVVFVGRVHISILYSYFRNPPKYNATVVFCRLQPFISRGLVARLSLLSSEVFTIHNYIGSCSSKPIIEWILCTIEWKHLNQ